MTSIIRHLEGIEVPAPNTLWFYTKSMKLIQIYTEGNQLIVRKQGDYVVQLESTIHSIELGGWWESIVHSLDQLPTFTGQQFSHRVYEGDVLLFMIHATTTAGDVYLVFVCLGDELELYQFPGGRGTLHYLTQRGYVRITCKQSTLEVVVGDRVYHAPRMHRLKYNDFVVNEYGLLYAAGRQALYIEWNHPTPTRLDIRNTYTLCGRYLLESVPTTGTITATDLSTGRVVRTFGRGVAIAYDGHREVVFISTHDGIEMQDIKSSESAVIINGPPIGYQWIPESSTLIVQGRTTTIAVQLVD